MVRSTEEWIAKHDDQKVPDRVRLRVFERHNGICHLSGVKIQPGDKWELEHIKALILGGEHRESNMAPALVEPHKQKTRQEKAIKSKIAKVRKKHLGITGSKQSIQSQGFTKAERKHEGRKALPPKPMFREAGE